MSYNYHHRHDNPRPLIAISDGEELDRRTDGRRALQRDDMAQIMRADFPWAFLGVALISASSVLVFMTLPANAGFHLAGGVRKKASEAELSER